MAYGLGVDLGTTYTAAAVVREGHVEMAPLGDRSTAMPSVILMRAEGGVLTGDAANRRAATEPDRVAREVKRRLGDPMPVLLGGTPYSAGDLMAAQLREVVAQISEREGGPPVAVRLTHPANWGPYKRELFEQVPRMAGLSDVTMITEPEAAAAHYAANERIADGTTVAVYDLGGGTFDATVLRTTGGGFEILGAPEGVEGLGGVDFDEAVFGHVDRSLDGAVSALDLSDPAATSAIVRLRQDCVLAKEALSSDTEATIPVLLPSLQTEVRLTRGEFETMIRPSVSSTIASLQRALESADISAEQVDTVLLVGGSSRIPLVAQMVSGELGRPTSVDAHPKHAIVLGAASLAEPPARAAGPEAPGPAHTSVFPTSGAPFRTPVPRVGPRTPPGGIPVGGHGRPAATPAAAQGGGSGTNSGLIPIVAGPRPSATGGFSTVSPSGTHGRPAGGRPGTGAFRGGGSGTGAVNAGTGSAPTTTTRSGGTYTGPTALRPTYTGPTRTVPARPGPAPTGATAAVHSQGPPTRGGPTQGGPGQGGPGQGGSGQGGSGGTGGRGAPPPSLGGRTGDDEPSAGGSRRRIPLIVGAVVLVAALAGGGTFAYRSLSADAPLPPAPTPSVVVAPTPLPTSAPPEPVNEPATGGSSSGTGGSGSAGSSGSAGGSGGSGGSGRGGGSGGSNNNGGTWNPPEPGHSTDGTTDGTTDGGTTDSGGTTCCSPTPAPSGG